jgi:hypothetical protein
MNRLLDDESLDLLDLLDGVVKLAFEIIGQNQRPMLREVVSLFFREESEFFGMLSQSYDRAQAGLITVFERAQRRGALRRSVDVSVLAQAVYAIVDFGILQFIAEPMTSKAAIQKRLRAQLRLLFEPYLTT